MTEFQSQGTLQGCEDVCVPFRQFLCTCVQFILVIGAEVELEKSRPPLLIVSLFKICVSTVLGAGDTYGLNVSFVSTVLGSAVQVGSTMLGSSSGRWIGLAIQDISMRLAELTALVSFDAGGRLELAAPDSPESGVNVGTRQIRYWAPDLSRERRHGSRKPRCHQSSKFQSCSRGEVCA